MGITSPHHDDPISSQRRGGLQVVLVGAGRCAWPVLVPVAWWFGAAAPSDAVPAVATYRQLVERLQLADLVALGGAYTPDLRLTLRIRPRPAAGAIVELRSAGGVLQQVCHADRFGAVDLPLDRALYAANPTLHVGGGGARVEFVARVSCPLPLQAVHTFPAVAVARALRQYGAAARAAGWRHWLAAPKWAHVVVRVTGHEGGCRLVGGPRRTLELPQSHAGEVHIDLGDIWSAEVRRIVCASPIEQVLLEWHPA
jgi:hypothetical protein